jgi:hypothetical protein
MEDAKGPERELPAAVGTTERQEPQFREFKGLAGVVSPELLHDRTHIGQTPDGALANRIDDQKIPAFLMKALDTPEGKIQEREMDAYDPFQYHFGRHFAGWKESVAKRIGLRPGALQRGFQRQERIPLLEMLTRKRFEA